MTVINELLLKARDRFKEVSDTPALDARILLREVLGKDELYLLTHRDEEVDEKQIIVFFEKVAEREKGRPIAYILGEKEFMGLSFKVTENTLIPRPDTEVLVIEAVKNIEEKGYTEILDLCSGSGAIGLSIAKILEFTNVTLSDINREALLVSMENGKRLGVNERLHYVNSDLFQGIVERYDMITCNPPYINLEDYEALSPGVRDFEPEMALYGGQDGLEFYNKISSQARNYLNPEGMIIFEIGYDQRQEVEKMLKNNGFKHIRTLKDLSGRDRVVSGILIPET